MSDLRAIRDERHQVMAEFAREMKSFDDPEPGYWLVQRVKDGPLIAARIWVERHPGHDGDPDPWPNAENRILGIFAEIAGKPAKVEEVMHRRRKVITAQEYEFLVADIGWLEKHKPTDPMVFPEKPVKLSQVAMPF